MAIKHIIQIGEKTEAAFSSLKNWITFLGEVCVNLFQTVAFRRHFRWISFLAEIDKVGVQALGIVGLLNFLVGVVLVYQGAYQLAKFASEIYAIDLLVVSTLREMGVLITAIIVAGRTASAYAAQIGTMKYNQEIDALHTMGINPLDVLIIPRIVALMVALPLLTLFGHAMSFLGGCAMSVVYLHIEPNRFLFQMQQAIWHWDFWTGIIKAPIFAFVIALIGCYEGLNTGGNAQSIGHSTTQAVVKSLFMIIVLDAIFSILYLYLGI